MHKLTHPEKMSCIGHEVADWWEEEGKGEMNIVNARGTQLLDRLTREAKHGAETHEEYSRRKDIKVQMELF